MKYVLSMTNEMTDLIQEREKVLAAIKRCTGVGVPGGHSIYNRLEKELERIDEKLMKIEIKLL